MNSAQARIKKRKSLRGVKTNKRKLTAKKNIFILLFPVLLLLGYLIFVPGNFDLSSRLSLAISGLNGEVSVLVFDTHSNTITKTLLPKNLYLETSHGLGNWQLGSLWRLGLDENLGGELLGDSITKSILLPIDAWASQEALGFFEGPVDIVKATLLRYKTNLSFKDRVRLGIYALGVRGNEKEVIDILDTGYLKKEILPGGEEGYVKGAKLPLNLATAFSIKEIGDKSLPVFIIDKTENKSLVNNLGEIIEVLGTKVVSVQKNDSENSDCVVNGGGDSGQKIAQIFRCDYKSEVMDTRIEITIGKIFEARF